MDYRISTQNYYKMHMTFNDYRVVGIWGLFLCFDAIYIVIGEALYHTHKKANNDN